MLGALIGDVAGSRFEWRNIKSKEFELLIPGCMPTDDSNMTLAVAKAILASRSPWQDLPRQAIIWMRELGGRYPFGFGAHFDQWLHSPNPAPYNSWGNGAAMRVSPCGWAAQTLDEALMLSDAVTAVSYNPPEGMKGARAVTETIFLARCGKNKDEIRESIREKYYRLDFTLDEIRPIYRFDVSCQGSVPQAIEAFLEGENYEDVIRNAISIGGDSDTIGAMAGSMAEAYFGVPDDLRNRILNYFDEYRIQILNEFEAKYGTKRA